MFILQQSRRRRTLQVALLVTIRIASVTVDRTPTGNTEREPMVKVIVRYELYELYSWEKFQNLIMDMELFGTLQILHFAGQSVIVVIARLAVPAL